MSTNKKKKKKKKFFYIFFQFLYDYFHGCILNVFVYTYIKASILLLGPEYNIFLIWPFKKKFADPVVKDKAS